MTEWENLYQNKARFPIEETSLMKQYKVHNRIRYQCPGPLPQRSAEQSHL